MKKIKFEDNDGNIVDKLGIPHEKADELQEFVCESMSRNDDISDVMDIMQSYCTNDNELAFTNYRIGKCANCPGRMLRNALKGKDGTFMNDEERPDREEDTEGEEWKEHIKGDTKAESFDFNLPGVRMETLRNHKDLINMVRAKKGSKDFNGVEVVVGIQEIASLMKTLLDGQLEEDEEAQGFMEALVNDSLEANYLFTARNLESNSNLYIYSTVVPGEEPFMVIGTNADKFQQFLKDNLPQAIGAKRAVETIVIMIQRMAEYEEDFEIAEIYIGQQATMELFTIMGMDAMRVMKIVNKGDGHSTLAQIELKPGQRKWIFVTKLKDKPKNKELLFAIGNSHKSLAVAVFKSPDIDQRYKQVYIEAIEDHDRKHGDNNA